MNDDTPLSVEHLSEEQIEEIVNTRGFRKMVAYSRLADGISVLEDEDEIYDSLVRSIEKQHSTIGTESSIREVLRLFREEVEAFAEPLATQDNDGDGTPPDMEDLLVEEGEDA